MSPQLETRRDVFDWLDSVACLPASDRQRLSELGIDTEAVRAALTCEQAVAELVRTLAGLLWGIDERLASATSPGYRSSGAERARVGALGRGPACDEDDELEADRRRRQFASVIARQGRGLSRMAASYAKAPSEREDLEQDIALALWQALRRFRGESSIETFAYRVARYCCFRHLRRRAKHGSEAEPALLASLSDPDICLETWLTHADELVRVEQVRAGLPETLEATLSLHLSGLSYSEIAEQLGISEQNVSVRLTRARHRIRARLVTA